MDVNGLCEDEDPATEYDVDVAIDGSVWGRRGGTGQYRIKTDASSMKWDSYLNLKERLLAKLRYTQSLSITKNLDIHY